MYEYLSNYHPTNYNPDNYWPGYEAVATPPGGSGMHRQRYDFTEWERQREEEELIILTAGWLA